MTPNSVRQAKEWLTSLLNCGSKGEAKLLLSILEEWGQSVSGEEWLKLKEDNLRLEAALSKAHTLWSKDTAELARYKTALEDVSGKRGVLTHNEMVDIANNALAGAKEII